MEVESYCQLQQDGKLQRAVRERMVPGLSTRTIGALKSELLR